jgi:hypothetical protein
LLLTEPPRPIPQLSLTYLAGEWLSLSKSRE